MLFQLYWHADERVTRSYVNRAEAAGYDAILVTVDFHGPRWIPPVLEAETSALNEFDRRVPLTDPAIQTLADEAGVPVTEFDEYGLAIDRNLEWSDLDWLADQVSPPIVVKGGRHAADAALAVERADGVLVSNHGGRQVAGEVGSAEALAGVVDAVEERSGALR